MDQAAVFAGEPKQAELSKTKRLLPVGATFFVFIAK
jgi:hypothetical protein